MSKIKYSRKVGAVFEYGHMRITDGGTKQEKREYVPLGTRPTMEAALAANSMAKKGAPRIGHSGNTPLWRD